jgi:hypothetical protein
MGIGTSIFLIALGAIFAFALEFDVAGVDIKVVGYILMIAGVIGAILSLAVFGRRDRVVTTTTPVREREIVRDRDPLV